MSAGMQFYPGASTAFRYDGTYEGLMQEVNCCVTHTTEGTSLPDYDGGAMAPNTTLLPDIANQRLRAYAHFPADMSARALVDNASTSVRTNRNNAHQVELVGSCDPKRRTSWGSLRAGIDYLYWPEAPEWALREYARYIAWLHTEHGVPLTLTPHAWLPYPDSYGSSNGQRMSLDEWAVFKGHCGHMHVPDGNDHGDPGSMRMDLVIQYAKELVSDGGSSGGGSTPPPAPAYEPFPGAAWFVMGRRSPIVAAMHDRLVAVGCNRYQSSRDKDVIGSGDKASYEAWQRKCGFSGTAATWPPGKTTWDLLQVPNV